MSARLVPLALLRGEAGRAAGRPGETEEGAEVDEGLIEHVPLARREDGCREGPDPLVRGRPQRVPGDAEEATENPTDIGVHDGGILMERETENRARGIPADAGEGDELVDRVREPAVTTVISTGSSLEQ